MNPNQPSNPNSAEAAPAEPLVTAPAPTVINPTTTPAATTTQPTPMPVATPAAQPIAVAQSAPSVPPTAQAQPGQPPVVAQPPTAPQMPNVPQQPGFGGAAAAGTTPAAVFGGEPMPPVPEKAGRRTPPKPVLFGLGGFMTLMLAGLVFYFGYWMNPSVVYKQGLGNTAKGYDRLVTYVDTFETSKYKGYTGQGNYDFKLKDGLNSSGEMTFAGDGENADMNFAADFGVTTIKGSVRMLNVTDENAEIYFKAGGVGAIGDALGASELSTALKGLDDRWIVVDPALVQSIMNAPTTAAATSAKNPTKEQIMDAVRAVGKVNQEYLYATGDDKAVLRVVKGQGGATVDGRSTYRYTVAFNKANTKKYITAQEAALKASKLNEWIKQNQLESSLKEGFVEAQKTADEIKESDTFDMWVDKKQRLIYKVRFSGDKNPAQNYADFGLNYKGGDEFPLFMSGETKAGDNAATFKMTANLDTKTSKTVMRLEAASNGGKDGSIIANLTFNPTNGSPKIEKPSNAIPLSQAMNQLGFGEYYKLLESAAASGSAATDPEDDSTITNEI